MNIPEQRPIEAHRPVSGTAVGCRKLRRGGKTASKIELVMKKTPAAGKLIVYINK
jgi:hypothetical protein